MVKNEATHASIILSCTGFDNYYNKNNLVIRDHELCHISK